MFKLTNKALLANTNAHPSSTGSFGSFSGGSNPFDHTGGNIFEQAAQRQQQQQNPHGVMPSNMPQVPPQPEVNKTEAQVPVQDHMNGTPNQGVNPQTPQQPVEGASPLDQFIQSSDNTDQGGNNSTQEPQTPPSVFDSNIDQFRTLAQNQNYAAGVTQEKLQAVLQGDVNALMDMLNDVGRNAFANASFASSQIAKSGFNSQLEQFQSTTLPQVLTDNNHRQALQTNGNEILKHPAVAPLVESQTQALRNQFPNASPQEIQDKVMEFFTSFAGLMTNQVAEQQQPQAPADGGQELTDLQKFFQTN